MKLQEQIERITSIHEMINKEQTGNPKLFAKKLHVSERQLYNIIDELKLMGAPIAYDKARETYFYLDDYEIKVEMSFNFLENKKD